MRPLFVLLLVAVTLLPSCLLFPDNGSTTTTSTPGVSGLLSSVPDSYSSGIYSVRGFVRSWTNLGGKTVTVRGVVVRSYVCPPCPPGAMCGPCPSPRITLVDPVRGGTLELVVGFGGDYSLARSLIVGEEIDVVVTYLPNEGGLVSAGSVPGALKFVSLQRSGRRFIL